MKRKGFILTEILTGLIMQAGFVITLCGAFYMLVTFSASVSNTISSNGQGQRVITYIDRRIRNAGLGFSKCNSSVKIAEAFGFSDSMMPILKDLYLPVAIMSSTDSRGEVVSYDNRYYEGNVLNLLYTHKDATQNELVVFSTSSDLADKVITIPEDNYDTFRFLFRDKDYTVSKNTADDNHNASNFALEDSANKNNLKYWAVMEASGVPFLISDYAETSGHYEFRLTAPRTKSVQIHPMSEILNLDFEKMYVTPNESGDRNFVFRLPKDGLSNGLDSIKYHARDILEIHMKLDTQPYYDPALFQPEAPIFDLKVLVSTGKQPHNDDDEVIPSACPDNWPAAYWREEFEQYSVQVLEASWKLYNLAGFTFGDTLP
ncbi:MAG: hypothetical protein IJR85_04875 [Synergistaceae bacterium]|nr:hypothetical protein [Synergistaceae bacterium]